MNLSRAAEKNFACSSPQNAQTTQKPTGLSFSNPQNGLRFAMQESTEMNACWSARCGELQAKEIQVQEPCAAIDGNHT